MKKNKTIFGNMIKRVQQVPFMVKMAVWQLEKTISQQEGHSVRVKESNLAIGLIVHNDKREVAVIYLDGERYWFVHLNEQVDKVSAISAGDYIVSMYFVTNISKGFDIEAEPGDIYKVRPKKKDIEIMKANV